MTVPRTRAKQIRGYAEEISRWLAPENPTILAAPGGDAFMCAQHILFEVPPGSIVLLPGEVEKLREAIGYAHPNPSADCPACEALALLAASEEKP